MSDAEIVDAEQVADRKSRRVTALLCAAAFMAMLDLFVVNVAFADIAGTFGTATLADLSWVLNGYTVTYAALLIPAGRLADRYGRKTGFMAGLAVFTVASLGCAAAPSLAALVSFRVLQAAGAAILTPASLGLILTVLPAARRPGAVKLWATTSSFAGALGPVIGGALAGSSWRWIFLINLPIGAAALVLAFRMVPSPPKADGARIPDPLGAAILAIAIGGLSLGLVKGNDWGWSSAEVRGAFAAGILGLLWLVRRLRNHPAPVIDPGVWRSRSFVYSNVTMILFTTAFGAVFLSVATWLATTGRLDPLAAGLAIAPGPLAVPLTAAVVQRLAQRVPARVLIAVGNAVFGIGAALLAISTSPELHYAGQVLPGWIVIGVGIGIAMPTTIASATATLPGPLAATGSAVVNTSRQLGYVLGVATLVAIIGSLSVSPGVAEQLYQRAWIVVAVVAGLSAVTAIGISPRPDRNRA